MTLDEIIPLMKALPRADKVALGRAVLDELEPTPKVEALLSLVSPGEVFDLGLPYDNSAAAEVMWNWVRDQAPTPAVADDAGREGADPFLLECFPPGGGPYFVLGPTAGPEAVEVLERLLRERGGD